MKWLRWFLALVVILVAGVYVFYKWYVGAVNVPLSDYEHDVSAVSQQISVPDGFAIGLYAEDIPNARLMLVTRSGDLLVANPNLNQILLLEADSDGDGKSDGRRLLMKDLKGPNGMDFHQGWLYIAETDAIGRIRFDHDTGQISGDYERIVTGLPGGENHWKKTLRFGPDGMMYVSIGSSCNVCIEADERRATLVRYQADGSEEQIFARGLRNSAGFDWSPVDGAIYATDNGRDLLGDDFPPCELNKVEEGQHYGWPYVNGNNLPDPDFGEADLTVNQIAVPPVHGFRAHNAPLGIVFLRGSSWPDAYRHAAIVALHGSWNRSLKDGYKVVSLHWGEDGRIEERDFVTGFLKDDTAYGRPAEVAEGVDGSLFIADDYAGVIYRVVAGDPASNAVVTQGELPVPGRMTDPLFDRDQTLSLYDEEQRAAFIAEGEALFARHDCGSCHSGEAGGAGTGLPLADLGTRYDVERMTAFLKAPTAPMPIFPLSDEEMESLSLFLLDRH